jgi:hypothetical protein
MLVIETGAQSITAGSTITYNCSWVDLEGNVTPATDLAWSSSNTAVATISNTGAVVTTGIGTTTLSATITSNGFTYKASVPLGIIATSVFAVAPSAIIYEVGGSLTLEPVYIGTQTTTYAYSSSDDNIASVNSAGEVTLKSAGECVVTVTASGLEGTPKVAVPVLVVGAPEIEIPVTKVTVSPGSTQTFRGQNVQFSAKAFNADGDDVTNENSFVWTLSNDTIASISATGQVTPTGIGKTLVFAQSKGIIGQAELVINPDTVIIVEPFYTSIAPDNSQQFTATAYRYDGSSLTELSGITEFEWWIPTYGIPSIDDIFSIGTINASGEFTVKSDAFPGNSGFVIAHLPGTTADPGVGTITVGIADDCDCGSDNSSITELNTSSTLNLSMFGNPTADISVKDQNDLTIDNSDLVFCSDNAQVASVDGTGSVMGTAEGTAQITICAGSVKTTVTVNVSTF